MQTRKLLKRLPEVPGLYDLPDGQLQIITSTDEVNYSHVMATYPSDAPVETGFTSGPVIVFKLFGAVVDSVSGAIFDSAGRLIRESFLTTNLMERYIQSAPDIGSATMHTGDDTLLPLATPRIVNFCRWWLDSLSKPMIVERADATFHGATPIMGTPFSAFQTQAVELLPHVKLTNEDRFYRADVVSSPGVAYGGGQRIASVVRELGPYWQTLARAAGMTPGRPYDRVLISRRNAKIRRVVNEDELAARLAPMGFETVELETLTLAQQMDVFATANVIVSPHGAGLTNIMFSRPGMKLVEIFPEGGLHGSAFMRMSAQLSLDYFCVVAAAGENRDKSGNPNNIDIIVDVEGVTDFVSERVLGDARR
jgi:hypothetical protein